MSEIKEGALTFSFPDHCETSEYDKWSFYCKKFQSMAGGSKAVDILCLTNGVAWLVEIKDYRIHRRTKPIDLWDEVAAKVRDTLSGLAAASANADDATSRRSHNERWRCAGGGLHCISNSRTCRQDSGQSQSIQPT